MDKKIAALENNSYEDPTCSCYNYKISHSKHEKGDQYVKQFVFLLSIPHEDFYEFLCQKNTYGHSIASWFGSDIAKLGNECGSANIMFNKHCQKNEGLLLDNIWL